MTHPDRDIIPPGFNLYDGRRLSRAGGHAVAETAGTNHPRAAPGGYGPGRRSLPPQASTIRSMDTTELRSRTSRARTARGCGPPGSNGPFFPHSSSGPRTRTAGVAPSGEVIPRLPYRTARGGLLPHPVGRLRKQAYGRIPAYICWSPPPTRRRALLHRAGGSGPPPMHCCVGAGQDVVGARHGQPGERPGGRGTDLEVIVTVFTRLLRGSPWGRGRLWSRAIPTTRRGCGTSPPDH